VRPVCIEERRCCSTVGHGKIFTRRPLLVRKPAFEPDIGNVEPGSRIGDTSRITLTSRTQDIQHDFLHWCHDIEIEEAVEEADLQCRHQLRRDMLDDDARFDDRSPVVAQHWHQPMRPEALQFGEAPFTFGDCEYEWRVVSLNAITTFWQYDEKGWPCRTSAMIRPAPPSCRDSCRRRARSVPPAPCRARRRHRRRP